MTEGQSCAFPATDEGESIRRWSSAHGAITVSVWVLVGLAAASLSTGAPAVAWATAGFSGLMALTMWLVRRLSGPDRLRKGSGMNPRTFAVYWNGQMLSYSMGVAVLSVSSLWLGSVPSGLLLIFVMATCLLAQLTPFCLGRLVYLMVFEGGR